MTTSSLPISGRRAVQRVADFMSRAPAAAAMPAHALIRALRTEFHMTQTQLAKRAGVTQPHLARIETGKVDVQLNTLRRILSALYCDTLVVPRLLRRPESVIAERAKEKARKNVRRVMGTMALERQAPDEETTRNLIRSEEARLLTRPSSEIWAD